MKNYKVGSLFAGVGGICLGFQQATLEDEAGFELIWANEIDEYACETYRTNFPHKLIEGDINKILEPTLAVDDGNKDIKYYTSRRNEILKEKVDILTAGFPCQAFSIAGDRKGFNDPRGNLFWSIVNLVKQLDKIYGKPRVLFLENVKNLKSHDKGRTYKVIKNELENLGYTIKESILNTMEYSLLPHNRERIYIIGFLKSEDANRFEMFDNTENFKIQHDREAHVDRIKAVIDYSGNIDERYYYTKQKYPRYFMSYEEYKNIPEDKRNKERINLNEQIDEMYQFYQLRRGMYVRKNKSNVCPTLTANMGTGGHNVPLIKDGKGIRKLTPSETFRLQGFPVGEGFILPKEYNGRLYADSHLYKQAGNAVSVPIARLLAKELLKVFVATDKKLPHVKKGQAKLF